MKALIAVIVVCLAIIIAVVTNPKREDYLHETARITHEAVVDPIVVSSLQVNNYIVFSTAKFINGDKTIPLGFGVLGNIYASDFEQKVKHEKLKSDMYSAHFNLRHSFRFPTTGSRHLSQNYKDKIVAEFDSLVKIDTSVAILYSKSICDVLDGERVDSDILDRTRQIFFKARGR